MEPETLVPLQFAAASGESSGGTAVILAGDHRQLGPAIRSMAAAALEESLMERLIGREIFTAQLEQQPDPSSGRPSRSSRAAGATEHRPVVHAVVKLLNNYRSHSDIIELPSKLFYKDQLRACDKTPPPLPQSTATLHEPCPLLAHHIIVPACRRRPDDDRLAAELERAGGQQNSADVLRCPPDPQINILAWVFCMSWCADFEFRVT